MSDLHNRARPLRPESNTLPTFLEVSCIVLENENISELQKLSYNVYVYIQQINVFSIESCKAL